MGKMGKKEVLLLQAIRNNDLNSVNKLLKGSLFSKGADVNLITGFPGLLPLGLACYRGYKDIIELLITKGADINKQDGVGRTPINNAAEEGHKDIVEFLIKINADINLENNLRESPLTIASKKQYKDIIEILKAHGAKGRILKNAFSKLSYSSLDELEQVINQLKYKLDANEFIKRLKELHFEFDEENRIGVFFKSKNSAVAFSANKDYQIMNCSFSQMGGDSGTTISLVESSGGGRCGNLMHRSIYDE